MTDFCLGMMEAAFLVFSFLTRKEVGMGGDGCGRRSSLETSALMTIIMVFMRAVYFGGFIYFALKKKS